MGTSLQASRRLRKFGGGLLGMFIGAALAIASSLVFLSPLPFGDDTGIPMTFVAAVGLCLFGAVAGLIGGILMGGRR